MNELLAIVREHDTSDRSDVERAWSFLAARARFYATNGRSTCSVCGKTPKRARVFTPMMSCGHEWSALMWIPLERAIISP